MSEPKNVFQPTRQHLKTGNLSFLTKQVAEWQKLTKLIQPLLPQPENWRVVCYQYGILTITGENQAMISHLQKLQVRLRIQNSNTETSPQRHKTVKSIQPATSEMLQNAASFVSDPKLSQALLRLASNKK